MLDIAIDKLGFIIELLREYEALVPPSELNEGSALEDTLDNPVEEEISDAISYLNDDEKAELIALIWLGRGDFTDAEWTEARNQAEDELTGHETAGYVMGTPLASEFIEEALSLLGYSIEDVEDSF